MSASQIQPRRCTTTHSLDGISQGISASQIQPRKCTATHKLEGISQGHVNNSNRAQEVHSNSQTGWDFMETCQQFRQSPGDTQQLTLQMGFHEGMSTSQIKPRRCTATHKLDRISLGHVNNLNKAQEVHSNSQTKQDFMRSYQQFKYSLRGAQQLTCWMGFYEGISTIQIQPRRCIATHLLDSIS